MNTHFALTTTSSFTLWSLRTGKIKQKILDKSPIKIISSEYLINIDLDQIYCIDMEDLDMGGSWDNDFINYVEFDLYACKKGIDYDENNENCTSYEKLMETASQDNSFEFDLKIK